MSHVYELYYQAFDSLRRVREVKTVEDNDEFCKIISSTLQEHLTVIPKLAIGVLECQDVMRSDDMDRFMNTLLRSVRPHCLRDPLILSSLTLPTVADLSTRDC